MIRVSKTQLGGRPGFVALWREAHGKKFCRCSERPPIRDRGAHVQHTSAQSNYLSCRTGIEALAADNDWGRW